MGRLLKTIWLNVVCCYWDTNAQIARNMGDWTGYAIYRSNAVSAAVKLEEMEA